MLQTRGVRWYLFQSAPWLPDESLATVRYVSRELKKVVGPPGIMAMGTWRNFQPGSPFLTAMKSFPRVESGRVEIGAGDYGDVEVYRGIIITNRLDTAAGRPINAAT